MNFIRRLMIGRYGGDQLTFCLLGLYLLLYVLALLFKSTILYYVGMALLLWNFYRMFSRNLDRRRAENARFLTLVSPLVRWCKLRHTIAHDREHRYFKCPNCGQQLRVPRGKGKVTVSCRNCGVSFEEKT